MKIKAILASFSSAVGLAFVMAMAATSSPAHDMSGYGVAPQETVQIAAAE
jgi:hypothetical protein